MTDLTNLRIFVCTAPIKMNLSFDGLMGLAQETFDQDPLSGHLFLFINRRRDRIKILFWDVDGFCIWYKRLEVGLFQLPVATEPEELVQEEPQEQVAAHSRRRRRELDLDKLPHYRHELDLSPAEKTCGCCGRAKDRIGEDQTKILDYVPSKLEVHVHVRPKYACRYCKDGVVSPLYERQKELVLQSPVLWTDDTPVTVLLGGREGSRKGRFWTYIGQRHPYSVYDFTESRARDGPAQFLAGFEGYLHADAYGGYDHIYLGSNESVVEVACWAHARRKFFDATLSSPRESHQILEWVGQLYDIEDRARESSAEARASLRQQEADVVLDRLECYLAELERRALPKRVLGKAVSYARNQWQALRRYTEDGRLSIDNNVSERTLRHQAIGRKNWLFLGSKQAGPRAAVLFTILAGAKRHRIEPWAYLREILLRLHAKDPRLDAMLPDRWAAQHPEMVLTYRLEESRQKAARQRDRRRRRRTQRRPK